MTAALAHRAEVACLELRNVSKSFGGFKAIGNVSFELQRGTINAIIGPNGAGKSTLFNLITGHYTPTSGTVWQDGRDITGIAPHRLSRLGIGRSFQRTNVFAKLTRLRERPGRAHRPSRARAAAVLALGGPIRARDRRHARRGRPARPAADLPAGLLSYGNQKQLELAIALALDPSLLLLDEPTAGMSTAETDEIDPPHLRASSRERGLTLLFTEHDMQVVFSICATASRCCTRAT